MEFALCSSTGGLGYGHTNTLHIACHPNTQHWYTLPEPPWPTFGTGMCYKLQWFKKYIYFSVYRCFACMYVCELHADNVHRNQKRVSDPMELLVNVWFAYLFMHLHTHSLVNISWVGRDHRRKCLRVPSVGCPLKATPSGSLKADSWEPWPLSV